MITFGARAEKRNTLAEFLQLEPAHYRNSRQNRQWFQDMFVNSFLNLYVY